MNRAELRPSGAAAPACVPAAIALAAALSLSGCSIVFTSSADGRVIDAEQRDAGNVVAVADARVFLYTEKAKWDRDYQDYVEGNPATLPDAPGKRPYRYFQSSTTDSGGNYRFSGVVWETANSAFGKTADKEEVYLLVYHPDYGLWRNPSPLIVVSDVTSTFPPLAIRNLYNEGRLAGRVMDWNNDRPLANAQVRIYVPESWTYSGSSVDEASLRFPRSPATTAVSGADGYWSADIRFRKMGGHGDAVNKTRAIVAWGEVERRAEDPLAPTAINGGAVSGDRDLDGNGRDALAGDNLDWYLLSPDIAAAAAVAADTGTVELQRFAFSALVSGRVSQGLNGVDGAEVVLRVPAAGGREFRAFTRSRETQAGLIAGFFELGTVDWTVDDIALPADQKEGVVPVALEVYVGAAQKTIASGAPAELRPDTGPFLNLELNP